jgi:hypothetical protein
MPLYVCGTCSQHFTRRYNANRHNKNIRVNRAEIVRFIEYLIGRPIGKYLASNPLSYRSKRRTYNKDVIIHESIDDKISNTSMRKDLTYAAEPAQGHINTNFINLGVQNNFVFNYFNCYLKYDNKIKEELQLKKITDDIKDIKRMLYDFHPAEQVQTLLFKLIGMLNAAANYASMEMELERYRNWLVNRYLGYSYSDPYT